MQWIKGEVDPETGTSWYTWNRKQLEKVGSGAALQQSAVTTLTPVSSS